jgi:hypothetical protein
VTAARVARQRTPLRDDAHIAMVLGLSAALASALLFPYLLDVMPALSTTRLPLTVLVPIQCLQAGVLVTLLSLAGLRMRYSAGLEVPWLGGLLLRKAVPTFPWSGAMAAGVAVGCVIWGLARLTESALPAPLHGAPPQPSAWHGFLASFYGGIVEESLLRLFLMTLLVWSIVKLRQRPAGKAVYWSAILIAAVLFGIGHLPAAAQVWPLTPLVASRTIVLNAIAGIAFGWLYWKRGLEVAMCAHLSADLLLHVAAPLTA